MNSNRKDIKKIDIDKLDIKAGLNASLDKEGISVSEDLVRRTLEAIRMNEASGRESGVNMTERKKPVFSYGYVRTFVAAAAAVLVLVAGLNAIRIFTPKTFKSDLAKQELDGAAGGSNMAENKIHCMMTVCSMRIGWICCSPLKCQYRIPPDTRKKRLKKDRAWTAA